jgi:thiamine kinase-like enzyme
MENFGGSEKPEEDHVLENASLKQWHETKSVTEEGITYFIKKYEPNSYEIRNEVSWLTSTMLRTCDAFSTPEIVDASIEKGEVKMEQIDAIEPPAKEEIVEDLVASAVELHSLIRSEDPKMRTTGVRSDRYNDYVKEFSKNKIEGIREHEDFPEDLEKWIASQADRLKAKYFTIVHRDLRCRHLLYTESKPVLIDWEFSNISEPAQDLAKLIYDAVVNYDMDMEETKKNVVDQYSHESKLSADETEHRVSVFLPIIPLEHIKSFAERKPEGYEKEILKDLAFIQTLFNSNK